MFTMVMVVGMPKTVKYCVEHAVCNKGIFIWN